MIKIFPTINATLKFHYTLQMHATIPSLWGWCILPVNTYALQVVYSGLPTKILNAFLISASETGRSGPDCRGHVRMQGYRIARHPPSTPIFLVWKKNRDLSFVLHYVGHAIYGCACQGSWTSMWRAVIGKLCNITQMCDSVVGSCSEYLQLLRGISAHGIN